MRPLRVLVGGLLLAGAVAGCSNGAQESADNEASKYADTNLLSALESAIAGQDTLSGRIAAAQRALAGEDGSLVPAPQFAWEASALHGNTIPIAIYYERAATSWFGEALWGRACRTYDVTSQQVKSTQSDCSPSVSPTPGPSAVTSNH